jgi:hypothetical protein
MKRSITANTRTLAFALLCALLVTIFSLGLVLAIGEDLPRSLVSSGGSIVSQSGLVLHSATGQPVAGSVANDLVLCSGYWCGSGAPLTEPPIIGDEFELFLPVIIR